MSSTLQVHFSQVKEGSDQILLHKSPPLKLHFAQDLRVSRSSNVKAIAMGEVSKILPPNLPPGALRAGHTQLRPAVIAARGKMGSFRAVLRLCLGKDGTDLYLKWPHVVL